METQAYPNLFLWFYQNCMNYESYPAYLFYVSICLCICLFILSALLKRAVTSYVYTIKMIIPLITLFVVQLKPNKLPLSLSPSGIIVAISLQSVNENQQ